MTIKGGSSLGASGSVSANGFRSLGLETVALSLRRETYGHVGKTKRNGYEMLTPLWFLVWSQHGPMILRLSTKRSNALV